jgi:hypothetical protein
MHRFPSAMTHLQVIRECVSQSPDQETRTVAVELIDRLEAHCVQHVLGKEALLSALDSFRGVQGTEESIKALEDLTKRYD